MAVNAQAKAAMQKGRVEKAKSKKAKKAAAQARAAVAREARVGKKSGAKATPKKWGGRIELGGWSATVLLSIWRNDALMKSRTTFTFGQLG
jgi:hypothetical protein